MNHRHLRLLAVGATAVLLLSAGRTLNAPATMTQTARAFLDSLTDEQRSKVIFKLEDDERFFWHYIPTDDIPGRYKRPRLGLTLFEMQTYQQQLATALLASGLSQSGMIKAQSIMSLEDILKIMEKDTKGRRNPERYHFSIFGDPSETKPWGFRVEGHHLSLHFHIVDGKLAGSPTFFGTNPHLIQDGPRKGLRVLAAEEDLGRDLLNSLNAEQRKVAVVTEKAPADILTEATRKAALSGQPNGLSAAKMTARQRELLTSLVSEYAYNVTDPIAEARMEKYRKAGNNISFAWAGTGDKGGPHYYRVQAPTFLIEYDNTQNGANHVHSVYRDFEGDFGEDLLAAHLKAAHAK